MKKFLSFLVGSIMGGLVGATVALLLAPASGEELRGQLQDRFANFKDELGTAVSERRVELEQRLDEMRKPPMKPAE